MPTFMHTQPHRPRLPAVLLGVLLTVWSLLGQAQSVSSTQRLNRNSAEMNTSNVCITSCDAERAPCASSKGASPGALCEDRYRGCVERCDPQRLNTGTIMALYPPSSRTVKGPRHLLPLREQMAICTQECSLTTSSCSMGGNSNKGNGSAIMGGGNKESACARSLKSCEARCEASITGDREALSPPKAGQR